AAGCATATPGARDVVADRAVGELGRLAGGWVEDPAPSHAAARLPARAVGGADVAVDRGANEGQRRDGRVDPHTRHRSARLPGAAVRVPGVARDANIGELQRAADGL